jgi:carboxymethylenebutenolidase
MTETLPPERLEQLWAEHLKGEFETKDVEATLATMVEDAYVNHMPVNTGGRGKAALRRFYRDDFIPSWPDDLQTTPVNRVVGAGQLVDELHTTFTHSRPMPWLLPNVPPTHKKIEMDIVVVVQFRGDKLAAERIYWDHAACSFARARAPLSGPARQAALSPRRGRRALHDHRAFRDRRAHLQVLRWCVGVTAKAWAAAEAEADTLGAVPERTAAHSPQIDDTGRLPHKSTPCRRS